jgi:PKD repeat protein
VRAAGWAMGLVAALVVLAIVATTLGGAQAAAACTATPTEVAPGEPVTLDASASENASRVEFDVDGNGTYDRVDDTDFAIQTQYDEPGTYEPSVRVTGGANDSDTAACGTVRVVANEPPDAQLVVDPGTAGVGETVTLDASGSTDPDGTIVEYRWDVDGDGTVDREGHSPTIEHAYGAAGSYRARVIVVDDDGANASATASVIVEAQPPVAACSVAPTTVAVGETVTIDARETSGADAVDVDVDGDGTIDRTLTATLETTVSYEATGTVEPTVTARNDAGEDRTVCGEIEIQPTGGGTSDGSDGTVGTAGANESGSGDGGILGALRSAIAGNGDGGPGSPRHLGGTLVLLGAAGWLLGRARQASDDPRPRGVFEWRSDIDERFAVGRFHADGDGHPTGEPIAVDVGFEPDLVLLAAGPGSGGTRTTEGDADAPLSNGVALRTDDGIRQHALGDEATDGAAVIQGAGDGARLGRVTATAETGFEFEPEPGLDATVCYRAIQLPADVTATVGTASVGAGDEAVRLPETGPIDALLLDAAAGVHGVAGSDSIGGESIGGESIGSDATGNRSPDPEPVGAIWSGVGTAVRDGLQQTAIGMGGGHVTVAPDRAIAFGDDGPRGRVVLEDSGCSLAYDDPASVDHVLQFVALAGVPALGPATGTVDVPCDESETAVPVGFEPAFVEYWVASGPSTSSDASSAAAVAGAVTFGAALRGPDGIEQVALGAGNEPSGPPTAGVEAFTEDGLTFVAAPGATTAGSSVTFVYRAWPGPLGRRRGAGGDLS